jgi:hypothetical protein
MDAEGRSKEMSSTMWEDDGDHWILFDDLQAAIHRRYYSPDEVIYALATCLGKVVEQADCSAECVAHVHRIMDSAIDFQASAVGPQFSGRVVPWLKRAASQSRSC